MAEWEDFEKLIAQIHAEVVPDAKVLHNHKLKDKRGRQRQFDVVIESQTGPYPLTIAIECRKYKCPVGIDKLDMFATKVRDCGVNHGVMVSTSGFDEGARSQAIEHRITLLSYREAEQADWERIASPASWWKLIMTCAEERLVFALCDDGKVVLMHPTSHCYNADSYEAEGSSVPANNGPRGYTTTGKSCPPRHNATAPYQVIAAWRFWMSAGAVKQGSHPGYWPILQRHLLQWCDSRRDGIPDFQGALDR